MRERLTDKRIAHGGFIEYKNYDKFAKLPNVREIYDRLCELEDKMEQGKIVELPCAVGSTLYRIDTRSVQCSHENSHYDEYWCGGCPHREIGDCDAHRVPYIFVIKNANAQAILGNEHLIGTRVFLDRASAEAKLLEMEGDNNEQR